MPLPRADNLEVDFSIMTLHQQGSRGSADRGSEWPFQSVSLETRIAEERLGDALLLVFNSPSSVLSSLYRKRGWWHEQSTLPECCCQVALTSQNTLLAMLQIYTRYFSKTEENLCSFKEYSRTKIFIPRSSHAQQSIFIFLWNCSLWCYIVSWITNMS